MKITEKLLKELQNRLKVGNRRGVHLNGIPGRSRYKFDLLRLSYIDSKLPKKFVNDLLTKQPLKFKISWKENVPDLNSLFEEEQLQLIKITKSFENLINQTEAIESEKGINTFGFGFPLLVRRDQADNKLTVAPILIWSLRIKRSKEFNTWIIVRDEDDPIYINEVLINHLQNDSKIEIEQVPSEMMDDGLIDKEELLDICVNLIKSINTTIPDNIRDVFREKLENIKAIPDKKRYEKLPLTSNNSFIDFGGLFSIFEVQKQSIVNDYADLLDLKGATINLEDMKKHSFQPISSIETDPSQQSILHSLESTRNILIQGPPGTGKSQTLTAILINALENHKKVLVVCEKRTALEVLHNSLNEKELGYQCVLIKDIVKNRRTVVNSVRERIDNYSYRSNGYSYSKDSLQNIIDISGNLINTINTKHKKLDEKLLGDKTWSHIVGSFLSENKENDETVDLKLIKNHFKYNQKELNSTIDIIRKGQVLYNDFVPFKKFSFINPSKFIGVNPYLIEEKIKKDFLYYKNQIVRFKKELGLYHEEYLNIRKNEITNQIEEAKLLGNIFKDKFKETITNIDNIKIQYIEVRESEFDNQIHKFKEDVRIVNELYHKYSDNILFLDDKYIKSPVTKAKSLFSKKLKEILTAHKSIKRRISKIESTLYTCNDIENVDFGQVLSDKKKNFYSFVQCLNKTKGKATNIINDEFGFLEIDSFISDKIGNQKCFDVLKNISLELEHSDRNDFKTFIKNTSHFLQNIEVSLNNDFSSFANHLDKSPDLDSISFPNTLVGKKTLISKFIEGLNAFNKKKVELIKIEVKNIDVLHIIDKAYETERSGELTSTLRSLVLKINEDNWLADKVSGQINNTSNHKLLETDNEHITENIKKIISINENDLALNDKTNQISYTNQNLVIQAIADNQVAFDEYFNNENDLFVFEYNWFSFYNKLSKKNTKLIDQLMDKKDWSRVFLIYYLNTILTISANNNLPTNNREHTYLNNILKGLESEQIKYIKNYWFSKQISATRQFFMRNPDLSVENLYNKRSSRKFKRLSLRQIVKFDQELFTTFFPIVLTTPDVSSNLFKGKDKYFDIVMFDEASQLKLEDNLPAMLKGKQIIVAGDEHQMPPSNYFSKIFDGTIDDENDIEEEEVTINKENTLLSCESLLDFATELNFDKKHLDFHYRSRHPYLIDFSNHAFYNRRLMPLPNTFDYIPFKYIQVNGAYLDHTNEAEAEAVLTIIENNINRLPSGEYPSVGIATFNIAQRNLIKSKIIERQKFERYVSFNEKILELEENGLFIKNLENIQGDERDVIILSTTYGINKDEKFAQRFGPINHKKGYKLLNVIITRAKYKVYVCTSIPEQVFLNYNEYLKLEGSNNKRAVFYAYLAYSKAVSDGNNEQRLAILDSLSENSAKKSSYDYLVEDLESPFEEEVYNALLDHFEANKIIPQFKFAGFRIDMVYDSKIKGIPRIAIECDGASYHSSKEAYLYDIHRQKILEENGFIFHRIWSTNWWRNPKREIKKLVSFIKKNEAASSKDFKEKANISIAFTDNVKLINKGVYKDAFIDKEAVSDNTEVVDSQVQIKFKLKDQEIDKSIVNENSKIVLKYVNDQKELTLQLVKDTEAKQTVTNGIQKISSKSPLAAWILGKKTGDLVKLGKLDNYVEILKIEN